MARKQLQARFDPDVVESVEDYADDHDVSRSEAMRRMLRSGLSDNGYEIAVADGVGTVGEIEKLRDELGKMEQRQVELAERRDRRVKRHWAMALTAGLLFVIASQVGTYSPLLIIGGGVIVLSAVVLATYRAAALTEDNDE